MIKRVSIVIVVAIICNGMTFLSLQTFAQQQSVTKATDVETKVALAKELIILLEFDKQVQDVFENVDSYLKRIPIEQSPTANLLNEKIYKLARIKYEKIKLKMAQELPEQFQQVLLKNFSSVELKYLIEFSKYPLYKKFKKLMVSESFYDLLNKPLVAARSSIDESKKELVSTEINLKVLPVKKHEQK